MHQWVRSVGRSRTPRSREGCAAWPSQTSSGASRCSPAPDWTNMAPPALCCGHSLILIASLGPCCPSLVGLGCVHVLHLLPSSNGVALGAARVLRHEVGNEVDV